MRVLLLVTLTFGITHLLASVQFFAGVESGSFDHRIGLFRVDKAIHPDVVVILIDDESLRLMNARFGRWPWPRNAFAELLDFMSTAGAQALAFDILFSERQQEGPNSDADNRLIESTRQTNIAVHALQLMHSGITGNQRSLPPDLVRKFSFSSNEFVGPEYDDYLLPFDGLYQVSPSLGFLEITPDRDGVYRRVRLFNQHQEGAVLPSLASAITVPLLSTDRSLSSNLNRIKIGDLGIPLDGNGAYLINPYGEVNVFPVHRVYETISQISSGQVNNLALDPDQLAGKLVLLGASAIGLLDVKATSLAPAEPGVFLHAYTVSNILQQDFLNRASPELTLLLVVLISGITVLSAFATSHPLIAILMHCIIAIGYLGVAYLAFGVNLVLPIAPVMFAFFLSLLMAYFARSYSE